MQKPTNCDIVGGVMSSQNTSLVLFVVAWRSGSPQTLFTVPILPKIVTKTYPTTEYQFKIVVCPPWFISTPLLQHILSIENSKGMTIFSKFIEQVTLRRLHHLLIYYLERLFVESESFECYR